MITMKKIITGKKLLDFKATLSTTPLQHEVLVGLILRDKHLSTQDNGKTWRLIYSQSTGLREQYFYHVYSIFQPWTLFGPRLIKEKKQGIPLLASSRHGT